MFDDQLATVWSAPNYCYRCGNMASILTIRENGEKDFTVYGPAEENERDTGMQTRRMVRVPAGSSHSSADYPHRVTCHTLCRALIDSK